MVRVKIGNILNCEENIIVHQVNVQGIMGGGIANGDWNKVYKIIEEVFSDYDVTLYKLEGNL